MTCVPYALKYDPQAVSEGTDQGRRKPRLRGLRSDIGRKRSRIDWHEGRFLSRFAGIGHEAVLRGDNVAGPQGGIRSYIEGCEAKRVLAVASAVGYQLLAVCERCVEIGVMLAVLSDGGADFTSEKDLGLAVRACRTACFSGCAIDIVLQRKVLTVT